jgi:hypothetical protein
MSQRTMSNLRGILARLIAFIGLSLLSTLAIAGYTWS